MSFHISMMAKVPEVGRVKTRMSPPLTAPQCVQVAEALLQDTWNSVARSDGDASIAQAGEGDFGLPNITAFMQVGNNLGERIQHALSYGLNRHAKSIVVGSDLSGLPTQYINDAAKLLDKNDVVVGPSADGGFYLLGVKRIFSLQDIPWSSSETLSAVVDRVERLGLSISIAQQFDDIDHFVDLQQIHSGARKGGPIVTELLQREKLWQLE